VLPEVPPHSHSFRAFKLLGGPVAKISIASTFGGFEGRVERVRIGRLRPICEGSSVFEMRLVKEGGGGFGFQRYTNIAQLGRYYSLTVNDRTTRLYTGVNFLMEGNVHFIERHLKPWAPEFIFDTADNCYSYEKYEQNSPANIVIMPSSSAHLPGEGKEESIPILFKYYVGGKMTSSLLNGDAHVLRLSSPKGEGLQFSRLMPGKVVIVAGGTGILPFSDLIDLLYKDQLRLEKPELED
jgi:hypothetical protein